MTSRRAGISTPNKTSIAASVFISISEGWVASVSRAYIPGCCIWWSRARSSIAIWSRSALIQLGPIQNGSAIIYLQETWYCLNFWVLHGTEMDSCCIFWMSYGTIIVLTFSILHKKHIPITKVLPISLQKARLLSIKRITYQVNITISPCCKSG